MTVKPPDAGSSGTFFDDTVGWSRPRLPIVCRPLWHDRDTGFEPHNNDKWPSDFVHRHQGEEKDHRVLTNPGAGQYPRLIDDPGGG